VDFAPIVFAVLSAEQDSYVRECIIDGWQWLHRLCRLGRGVDDREGWQWCCQTAYTSGRPLVRVSASLRPIQRSIQQGYFERFLEHITLIQCAILHRFRQSIPSIQQTFYKLFKQNLSDRIFIIGLQLLYSREAFYELARQDNNSNIEGLKQALIRVSIFEVNQYEFRYQDTPK